MSKLKGNVENRSWKALNDTRVSLKFLLKRMKFILAEMVLLTYGKKEND
jgi:hypothetical protein